MDYDSHEVVEQIRLLMQLAVLIPEKAIQDTIDHIETKVGGACIFIGMGEKLDFNELSRNKKRAEGLLDFIKILKETNIL